MEDRSFSGDEEGIAAVDLQPSSDVRRLADISVSVGLLVFTIGKRRDTARPDSADPAFSGGRPKARAGF